MNIRIDRNPFDVLDATEVNVDFFVQAFSDALVKDATPLFAVGNVVVRGMQGSGKSMLLGLLSTQVRVAYKAQKRPYPQPADPESGSFLAAVVNLSQEGVAAFGHRLCSISETGETHQAALLFADYLNYAITASLLDSLVASLEDEGGVLGSDIGADSSQLDLFASKFALESCWFGALGDVTSFCALRSALRSRLNTYRGFFNFNINRLPQSVIETKTEVGRPVISAATLLRSTGVLPRSTKVFVVIDQFDELVYQRTTVEELEEPFRRVINSMLASRSPAVFYRIGTRGYTWDRELRLHGSDRKLEADRDYQVVNLDLILRSTEHDRGVFPQLAKDVLSRRLEIAGYDFASADPLKTLFGPGLSPQMRAREYAGAAPLRVIRVDERWPEPFKAYLAQLAVEDPLEARFAEAWARQKGKGGVVEAENFREKPWRVSPWWTKERTPQALTQIAGRCQQALRWSGKLEILALSGGNMLAFLAICRQIWDAWGRNQSKLNASFPALPIPDQVQSAGILNASDWWLDKIIPGGFDGDSRLKFVRELGRYLSAESYRDEAMSYPGGCGFSISLSEISLAPGVARELDTLCDHGDLYQFKHTTKNSDKRQRMKWYPAPIICPALRLPHQRIKEPLYLPLQQVAGWLRTAGLLKAGQPLHSSKVDARQGDLFE